MPIRHLLGEVLASLLPCLQRRMHDLLHTSLDHLRVFPLTCHPLVQPLDDLHGGPRCLLDTQVEGSERTDAEPGFHVARYGAEVHTVIPEATVGLSSEVRVLDDEDATQEVGVTAKVPRRRVSLGSRLNTKGTHFVPECITTSAPCANGSCNPGGPNVESTNNSAPLECAFLA